MPAYQFTAMDAAGKQQKGVLEGDSARQIRQQLRDKEWISCQCRGCRTER